MISLLFLISLLTALHKHSLLITEFLDQSARCRWSTHPGESLLYVKYEGNKLNILDVEKAKHLLLNDGIELDNQSNWSFHFCFV